MKLYFTPGACSLSPHIVLHEAGVKFDLEQVDLREKRTKAGADYWQINSKGQVPVLELDSGDRISEGAVIVQYIADQYPASKLAPPAGTPERYKVMEWLSYVGSELHKSYGPMFRPTTPDEYKKILKTALAARLKNVDRHLEGRQYLMGDGFSVSDAYMFTILRWSPGMDVDLSGYPSISAYMERIRARPAVQRAMITEGLIK